MADTHATGPADTAAADRTNGFVRDSHPAQDGIRNQGTDACYSTGTWVSADGLSLHYRDYPGPAQRSGPPVICLHGLTRNARDFAKLAEHIAPTHRVIVPEMRGRGESDYASDAASYHPAQYVADLERLIETLRIDQFIAIGTSLGGLVTMLLAHSDASRIKGAVLNDIGPEIEPAGLERIAGYVGQGRSYPTWVHAARALCDVHGQAFPDFRLEDWLAMAKRNLTIGQNGRITYNYDMAIAQPFQEPGGGAPADLWPAFEALNEVPTVLIRGALSDLLSPATVERMRARHLRLTVVDVPRVGHAPTLDEPEARAAIDALLAKF